MRWYWDRFDALASTDLYAVLALRQQVFAVEQSCAYLDADGVDPHCWHLRGVDESGDLAAYLRLVDPGRRYEEPSLGRVLTAAGIRGRGIGRLLMSEGLAGHDRLWPGRPNRISAQARLGGFYVSLGFIPAGEPYLEDGIPHVQMLRTVGRHAGSSPAV